MTLRFGLKDLDIQKICDIFSRHPEIEKAILYGSRAKGNFKNGSDIDLTLVGGPALTVNVLYKIMDELDGLPLPYSIDLSIFSNITDTHVIEHIRRVGVIFYP